MKIVLVVYLPTIAKICYLSNKTCLIYWPPFLNMSKEGYENLSLFFTFWSFFFITKMCCSHWHQTIANTTQVYLTPEIFDIYMCGSDVTLETGLIKRSNFYRYKRVKRGFKWAKNTWSSVEATDATLAADSVVLQDIHLSLVDNILAAFICGHPFPSCTSMSQNISPWSTLSVIIYSFSILPLNFSDWFLTFEFKERNQSHNLLACRTGLLPLSHRTKPSWRFE